jgi:L-gulonate 3-dehydrogenase
MPSVAIVGAGLIGRAWAVVFSRAGWEVRMTDPHQPTLAAAPGLVRASLESLAEHGLVTDPASGAARVSAVPSLAEAVAGVALVQENGPEVVDAKRAIFAELDRLCAPDTILASSTSAIVASLFTEDLPGRARCLVGHPVNPPHLVPIVEICGAPWTSADVIARAKDIYAAVEQVPVIINREVEGFVVNRLQGALLAEAFRLAGEGVISPQDLDKTIKDGLGLRWSFLGPFETIELNAPGGIADYCARYTGFYRRLSEAPPAPEVWDAPNVERILAAWGGTPSPDTLARKSAGRDSRLAALKAHKRAQRDI